MSTTTEPVNSPSVTEVQPQRTVWPDLSLLGVALIWGVNIPVMKIGLVDVEPFAFNAVRLALSALVLAVLALRESSPSTKWPPGLWKQIAIYAVIASGMYQILFLLGVTRTATGNGSLIMATVPMWTALLARFLLGERLNWLARIGLTTAFLGTLVVALEKGISGDRHLLIGNFFMLMAALTWAWGTVQSRKVLPYISPMRLSAISAASMLPVQFACAATSLTSIVPRLDERNVLGSIVYAGVLSTGLALPMWSYGVRHSGAAQAAVFQNLVPIVAIASAWLIQGDPVTSSQILGGVLILGGLVLVRRSRG
ncbi:MAG: DMT family transporter [Planctomycetaceae bacterium]